MATKTSATKADDRTSEATEKIGELLETVQKTEHSALDAMHRFADSISDAFPDVGEKGEGPRSKIIEAAFKLTGEIVDAGHRMVSNVLDAGSEAVSDLTKKSEAQAG